MKELNTIAASALEALKSRGAEMGAAVAAYSETREFNVDGGEFSLFRTMFDNSLKLTGFVDGRKGVASVNHFDDASIRDAADNCIAAAEAVEPDKNWELGPGKGRRFFEDGVIEADMELLFSRCRELMETVKAQFPKIIMEQMIVDHKSVHKVYVNTNGSCFERRCGYYSVSMMFSGHDGGRGSSFFGTEFNTVDLSRPFIEQASVRRDLGDVENQIETEPVSGKFTGCVLVPPGCLGEILYYTLQTFADGSAVCEGTSIWKDKLGKKVADDRLSIFLAPCSPEIVGGERWTDDGFISEDFPLIENGVLRGFIMNQYFANKSGMSRSPNSAISNMIIPAGETPLDDIIKGIDNGLVVGRVSGGNPASAGDFSMVAKNSFIIKDGKIGKAVSELMINGNLAQLLNSIRAISVEKEPNGGTSLPWIAFDGVTISGK